jgi:hypothetical protein
MRLPDDQQLAFTEHMEAMIAEIEATGECSMPPFSFVTPEQAELIAEELHHA